MSPSRFSADTPPEERGSLSVAPRVIEKIAQAACLEVDGSLTTHTGVSVMKKRLPHVDATVAGSRAQLEIEIAAQWPMPLTHVANNVKDRVSERLATLAAVDVERAVVTVAMISSSSSTSTRRRVQ